MKIVLAQPPMPDMVMAFSPPFMHKNVGKQPPMGLINVATYLKQHSDHEVVVLDSLLEDIDHKGFGNSIQALKPDLVGITTTTMSFYDALLAAKTIKSAVPGCKVILGGPHTSVYPEETIKHEAIDYVLEGEGEIVFKELVDLLVSGDPIEKVPGLYFMKNGQVIYTGTNPFIEKIENLPIPDRKLTDYKGYFSAMSKRQPMTNMMTSRGCPFKCTYCNRMGKKFRFRSTQNVLAEIKECMDLGIQDISFYDDTFTIKRQRVLDICHGIIKEGWDFSWNIRTRVDCVDEEMLMLLKKAGCERVHYGIEAGNPRILKLLKKNIKIEDVIKAFSLTRKCGMETYAYLMIGSPEESEKEIEETINLVKQIKADYSAFAITTPMPGTELYSQAFEQKLYKSDHWRDYIQNPSPNFEPLVWEKEISRKRLCELQIKAYKKFYSDPVNLFNKIRSVKSFKEFSIKSKIAVQMFLTR